MQKTATNVFIIASVVFGAAGVLAILTAPGEDTHVPPSDLNQLLTKIVMVCVFIILPSFALSVASKYLNSGK